MRDFRELQVWVKAHKLALSVYRVTAEFPKEETYGITAQMRRATSSIPMNVAEGCGGLGDAELNRFLIIASGSARELEYQLLLARDLNVLDEDCYSELDAEVQQIERMLAGFTRRLRSSVGLSSSSLIANR